MSKKKFALACTICKQKNYFETKSNGPRLEKQKFCKKCATKTLHKEEK
ncbi:50S ribosomal protein L33 [Candidatus Mycoplasma mahonii]|nr:50S ribosomal protein L33 [Candidatus Mycoplasma mahonii]WKX02651.1 50S ribosomal protein L33 [Candidatus Mycoplasma mahonii]